MEDFNIEDFINGVSKEIKNIDIFDSLNYCEIYCDTILAREEIYTSNNEIPSNYSQQQDFQVNLAFDNMEIFELEYDLQNFDFNSYSSTMEQSETENQLRKEYSWERVVLFFKPFKIDGRKILNSKEELKAICMSVKLYQNWTERLIQCYCQGIKEVGDQFKEKWELVMKKNTNLLITQLKDVSKILNVQIPKDIKQQIKDENIKVDSDRLSSLGISVSKIHNYKSNLNRKKKQLQRKQKYQD